MNKNDIYKTLYEIDLEINGIPKQDIKNFENRFEQARLITLVEGIKNKLDYILKNV